MIALVPRHGTKNPIFGVLAHGLIPSQSTSARSVAAVIRVHVVIFFTNTMKKMASVRKKGNRK